MASPTAAVVAQPLADGMPECGVPVPPILASIVATIGPASESPQMVRRLIQAGVSVFRFNFSHGDFAAHARRLRLVREVASDLGVSVACLGDLQGPKIRVGVVPAGLGEASPSGGGSVRVAPGEDVVFKRGLAEACLRPREGGHETILPITYAPLVDEVQVGHKVLINDGAVRLLAVERVAAAGELRCRVTVGGKITSNKGINVPQSDLSAPAITARDWECVAWALANGLDYLALSFVRRAAEVRELREHLAREADAGRGGWIPVIAKIEMPQAVDDLEAIVSAADGVMVARGDLGVEMDIAQVPVVQKQIVGACRRHGKPCIVATQMLETMIESATPTRAEASDVANAIFDGADAVMLSGETATGRHPALVVETMARIVAAAEEHLRRFPREHRPPSELVAAHRGIAALAHGAWDIAADLNARAVVCWSQQGGTARYLSQNRFSIPVVAYSSDPGSCRRMALLHGVTPVCAAPPASGRTAEWILDVERHLLARRAACRGDAIVLLSGRPLGQAKGTTTLTIHRVGESPGL